MKRFLAVLLTAIMIISIVPLSASAANEWLNSFEFKATTSQSFTGFVGMKMQLGATVKIVDSNFSLKSVAWYNKTDAKTLTTPGSVLENCEVSVASSQKIYAVQIIIHDNNKGTDHTTYGGQFVVKPITTKEITNTTESFDYGTLSWNKADAKLTINSLNIADTSSNTTPLIKFSSTENTPFNITIDVKGNSMISCDRSANAFDFRLENKCDNSVTFTGDGMIYMVNGSGNAVGLYASSGHSNNLNFSGTGSLNFWSRAKCGLYNGSGTNIVFRNKQTVSLLTNNGSEAMNKFSSIVFKNGTSIGVKVPEGGYASNGRVYDLYGNVPKSVTFGPIYPKPVIGKISEESIYTPVNYAYTLSCEASCKDGGAPKYWWEYNMDYDTDSTRWSAIGTSSLNGEYTTDAYTKPKTMVYRVQVGNSNAGDNTFYETGIYSDPICVHFVENPFRDIVPGAWYTSGALYCSSNGVMSGTATDKFEPDTTVTRAMFVMVLANMAKVDLNKISYKDTFKDVPNGQWYSKAVIWAADNGITSGTTATTFSPNDPVTREQLATFFYSYAKKFKYDISSTGDLSKFSDKAQISNWALTSVKWAVGKGLISGTSATTVSPKAVASRAQIALIAKNFNEKIAG